jgi:hypothetical protein
VIDRWDKTIVKQCSRRSLTIPQDKRTAISGIVRHVCRESESDYLARLWLYELQYGLYWTSVGPAVISDVYRGPSFS